MQVHCNCGDKGIFSVVCYYLLEELRDAEARREMLTLVKLVQENFALLNNTEESTPPYTIGISCPARTSSFTMVIPSLLSKTSHTDFVQQTLGKLIEFLEG